MSTAETPLLAYRQRCAAANRDSRPLTASAQGKVTIAEGVLRPQHRGRLLPPQLRPVHRRTGTRSTASPTGCRSIEIGKSSEGRPQLAAIITSPENFKLLAQVQGHLDEARQGRGSDGCPGARAGEGRQGGRLVRRRSSRHGSARRESADRDDLPADQPQRRRDDAAS